METNRTIQPPFFEIGPKAYMYGKDFLDLAIFADGLTTKYEVNIIVTPQYVDIPGVFERTKNIFVFAQHMDAVHVGRGIGSVLPEAIKAAGACGVLLNHVERRLSEDQLSRTIDRANEVGLMTMVCADDLEGIVKVARFNPTIVIAESPDMIGGGKREKGQMEVIRKINDAVKEINPKILVLHGAGINGPQDVFNVIAAGAEGTGSTSGIMMADDPFVMLESMIKAVHDMWRLKQKV